MPLTVTPPSANGAAPEPITFDTDEGPRRDTDMAALGEAPARLRRRRGRHRRQRLPDVRRRGGDGRRLRREGEGARALAPSPGSCPSPWPACPPRSWASARSRRSRRPSARAGLKLEDIEVIELNEAFATQALAVIKAAELDPDKVNVNGGAVALGHPLGCTGAKLSTQMLHELKRREARYGMVTMCVGGGMGAAGVFERL